MNGQVIPLAELFKKENGVNNFHIPTTTDILEVRIGFVRQCTVYTFIYAQVLYSLGRS